MVKNTKSVGHKDVYFMDMCEWESVTVEVTVVSAYVWQK